MRRDLFGAVGLTVMLLLSLAWCGQNPADSGPAPEMSAWQWDHVRLMAPAIRERGYICDFVIGARQFPTTTMAMYRVTCAPGPRVYRVTENFALQLSAKPWTDSD